ncbi:hypothetical protein ACW2Q0_04035 [Nocardia sp. R16R-3T]
MSPIDHTTNGRTPNTEKTARLEVSQAVARFLANQYIERDGMTT